MPVSLKQGGEQAQPGDQQKNNDEWARPGSRRPRTLRQRLAATLVEGTGIRTDTGVESTTWVARERFLGKVPALTCENAKTATEKAKRHTDGPLEV